MTSTGRRSGWNELVGLLTGHRAAVALAGVLMLAGASLSLAQPLIAGRVVDAVRDSGPVGMLVWVLIAVFAVQIIVDTSSRYVLQCTGESVVLEVRRQLVGHLMRLPVRTVDHTRTGDLVSASAPTRQLCVTLSAADSSRSQWVHSQSSVRQS